MPKDDYDVIVFKLLTYLYACLKRTIVFDGEVFAQYIAKAEIAPEYFVDILCMMQEEGLISGLVFKKVWGGNNILVGDISEAKITANGIRYLNENSKMKIIRKAELASAGLLCDLVKLVMPE